MAQVNAALKEEARRFLVRTQEELTAALPDKFGLRKIVWEAVSPQQDSLPHCSDSKTAFLHAFFIPRFFDLMQTIGHSTESEVRQSLLCGGYENVPKYSSGTPVRTEGHPFTKLVNTIAADIVRKWMTDDLNSLAAACPDFALRPPFPFKVVFSMKYFEQGNVDRARRDLVTSIHEAFFYRALPYVPPKESPPAWDYDFACLVACDASYDGTLSAALNSFAEPVRRGLWDGGNVYVMLLRPR